MNVEERIKKIEDEIQEVKKAVSKAKKQNIIERVKDQLYWFVGDCGTVCNKRDCLVNVDYWRCQTGNYFLNEQEVEDYKKYLTIQGLVREIARRYPPCDWENVNQTKYHILYSTDSKRFTCTDTAVCKYPNDIYCSSPVFFDVCHKEIGLQDLIFYCEYEV